MSKRPAPIVALRNGQLVPVSAYDAEEVGLYPSGQEFDLVARSKRSSPFHRRYWGLLKMLVDTTGRWGRPEVLHEALKVQMGYVEPLHDLKGNVIGYRASSTAFDKMTAKEWKEYYEMATIHLSAALGFDVDAALDMQ